MLKKKKAQFAIEFTVLIAFMFLIFLSFISIVASKVLEAKEIERQEIAKDLAILAKNEIDLAKSSTDGYSRTFKVPSKIKGNKYKINIIDNRELVVKYPDTAEDEYVIFLQEKTCGVILDPNVNTKNEISKTEGCVFINTDITSSSCCALNIPNCCPDCKDGIDNDGDGDIDFGFGIGNDKGCSALDDLSEFGTKECDDGIDNDGDGFTDFRIDPLIKDQECDNTLDDDESS